MANSDYKQNGGGTFATFVKAIGLHDFMDTTIAYGEANVSREIETGMVAVWDDEICSVAAVAPGVLTLKRGCADTLPQRHVAGSIIWIIDNASVGTDGVERSAGETVSVKVQPYTLGGGPLPIHRAPPNAITFNWRFFRPYNAAHLMANAARWYNVAALDDANGGMNLTWVHRDRVLQADQLLGQDDASIGPEHGTTYTMRVYNIAGVLLRTEPGITGTSHLYQYEKALHDFGRPTILTHGLVTFHSERQMTESLQGYTIPISIEPSSVLSASEWLAFEQRVFETPYLLNVRRALPVESSRTVALAARPADRMSDDFNLIHHWTEVVDSGDVDEDGDPIYITVHHNDNVGTAGYIAWLTADFALPELETTMTIRRSSLYDGVAVPASVVGKLGLIEDELVVIKAFDQVAGTLTVGRGCGDTIPAHHIAGTRLWIIEPGALIEATNRSGSADYRFQPGVFGAPVDPVTLDTKVLTFKQRALRPYPVGQLVVAGRPWFEEAVMQAGQPLLITWAWRNRVTQGGDIFDHAYPSIEPESDTEATLTFFYENPPGVEHVLRTVTANPVADLDGSYSYPYALAQADGNTAGLATGVCGTVVIYCRLSCVRGGRSTTHYASLQSYRIPIRVPSNPCI